MICVRVIYRNAERSAYEACADNDFFIVVFFLLAGIQCIFQQVAEKNGNIGFRNKGVVRNICLYNIVDTVVLCMLGEIQQNSVCGGILAETNERIVGQAFTVSAEIFPKCVKLIVVEILLHEGDVMANIVLCSACIGDFFLQIFVLHRLHGKLMVFLFQFERFALLKNQTGYNIVNEYSADIDGKEKQRIFGPQSDFKAGIGNVAVECVIPHDIKCRRNEP